METAHLIYVSDFWKSGSGRYFQYLSFSSFSLSLHLMVNHLHHKHEKQITIFLCSVVFSVLSDSHSIFPVCDGFFIIFLPYSFKLAPCLWDLWSLSLLSCWISQVGLPVFSSSVLWTLEHFVYAYPVLIRAEGLLHKNKLVWLDMISCVKSMLSAMHLLVTIQMIRTSVLNYLFLCFLEVESWTTGI